ncbi:hypothetical protein Lxx18790 [Leifsonia xyli subsp. xyli str. CTCB07]|uniref:Lipoprotein n=2 Tax=Leifsonia xyli subsp. xyli TaxID=59736 RepID=Q6ADD4_LEIXX|nr:hypothetical protein Lxx18790 [Leifsonia xyli subsp. xyli str. CTCB07]
MTKEGDRMTSTPRRPLRLLPALIVALSLAACSAPTPAAQGKADERLAGSLTELFTQELGKEGLSDFERSVLKRAVAAGKISEEDYDEAFQRYSSCVADLGYKETWNKLPNGLYRVTPPALGSNEKAKAYLEKTAGCADGTVIRIESLYLQQQANPDLLADPRAVAIQCFRDLDAVDAGYTPEDFDRDAEGGFASAPFFVEQADVNNCLYSAGYSVATGDTP